MGNQFHSSGAYLIEVQCTCGNPLNWLSLPQSEIICPKCNRAWFALPELFCTDGTVAKRVIKEIQPNAAHNAEPE